MSDGNKMDQAPKTKSPSCSPKEKHSNGAGDRKSPVSEAKESPKDGEVSSSKVDLNRDNDGTKHEVEIDDILIKHSSQNDENDE